MDRPDLIGTSRALAISNSDALSSVHSARAAIGLRCAAATCSLVLGAGAAADIDANTWIGASSGSWFDARSWSLGVVPWNDARFNFLAIIPESPRGDLEISIGSDMPVIDALSVGAGASLDVHAGAGLAMVGGAIDNNGTIGLWGSFGEPVTLRLDADETNLYGAGEVIGGDGAATIRAANPTGSLFHAKGHRITGALTLGADSLRLTNEGEIVANNGTLTLDLTDGAGINSNSGMMRAERGATLEVTDCEIDNTNGLIEAGPGSTVRFGGIVFPFQFKETRIDGGMISAARGETPGRIEVAELLRLEDGATVDAPVHVGSDLNLVPAGTEFPTLWVGEGTKVPELIYLGGFEFLRPGAWLYSPAQVAAYDDCTVIGSPNGGANKNYILGEWDNDSSAVIGRRASFLGYLTFEFEGGIVNHGLIEGHEIRFGLPGPGLLNAESGRVRLPASLGVSFPIWGAQVVNRGELLIGSKQHLFMNGGSIVQEAGTMTIDGAISFPNSSRSVRVTGGVLTGSGSTAQLLEVSGGTLAPAGIDGPIGTFTVKTGPFVLIAPGALEIDLGAAADSMVNPGDRLAVTGAAQLDGTLRVRLVDGFVPMAGETFVVLTASSVSGVFSSVESDGHCEPFDVVYAPTSVSVVFAGASASDADFNDDGVVDGDDLGALLGAWGKCAEPCCPADLNGDGVVNGDDLGALLGAWS